MRKDKKKTILRNPQGLSNIDVQLGDTLKRLRKCTRTSQEDLGKILSLHQAAVCRVEQSAQNLTPKQLLDLGNYFDVRIDDLVYGQINYWDVAKRFGQEPPFPKRYLDFPFSKIRESLPTLYFMRGQKGEKYVSSFLDSIGMSNVFFLSADQTIGVYFHLDLVAHCLSKGFLNEKTFEELIGFTHSEVVHDILTAQYQNQTSTLNLIESLVLNQARYQNNFEFHIEQRNRSSLKLSVVPQEHLRKVDYKGGVLKNFICDYQRAYLENFPKMISKKPVKLHETECHFKGKKRCRYVLAG